MAKVMSGRAPKYIEDLFRTKEQITSLVLRDSSNKLVVPFPKTDCFKQSISYSGATFWNSLPRSERNAATFFTKLWSSDYLVFALSKNFYFSAKHM